jgi:tRNA wybutosine-synthesizing protein 3
MSKNFIDAKEKALASLNKDLDEKKVDHGLIPLLDKINRLDDFFTTSSCAGRILLLEIPDIGDKKEARFIEKWHDFVTKEEIISKIKESKKGMLWLLAQPPVIHVGAKNLDKALKFMKIANESGFKNTFIKNIGKNKVVIEICSTERMDTPIGEDGEVTCSEKQLEMLVEIANNMIKKSKDKIERLEKNLNNLF